MPPKWRTGRLALKLGRGPSGATAALTLPNFSYPTFFWNLEVRCWPSASPPSRISCFWRAGWSGSEVRTSDQIVPTARLSVPMALDLVEKLYPAGTRSLENSGSDPVTSTSDEQSRKTGYARPLRGFSPGSRWPALNWSSNRTASDVRSTRGLSR